jgi:hypothetical protein
MNDPIYRSFLEVQHRQAMALAAASDILELQAEPAMPPQKYFARFHCRGLVQTPAGEIAEADEFDFAIYLPDDYLRAGEPRQIVNIVKPWSIWHPNAGGPFICLGRLSAGTPLVDILFQTFEIITYQKWSSHDGLNPAACEWARNHQARFPIDRRPLKWKGVAS